ncbi:MAG: SMI1/KNR4 family protein [Rubrobacteraceae bacterium]|nr:SMI1/KNR4 family protein [Rubrobacteraceae bacterium]
MLASAEVRGLVPSEAVEKAWIGFDGATEREIHALESRLGVRLPPSYRSFLSTSNGWRLPGPSVYDLWPTTRVAWFAETNQDWIDAYVEPYAQVPPLPDEEYLVYGETQDSVRFRPEYLQTALQISDRGDSAVYLLNPRVVTPEEEWEAWLFANWLPGAAKYRSFREMMQAERESFLRLLSNPT